MPDDDNVRVAPTTGDSPGSPDTAPSPSPLDFPVVGIGASAGGLGAFETFLEHLPDDPGMAFVLVQHLDPDRESELAGLLQRVTDMSVVQVENDGGMALEPNAVYVIPPAHNMTIADGQLHLSEMESSRAERAPIDFFFRSLAESQDGNAVGVVLSGTGSGGTSGLKRIKEKGGVTLVQDPDEAEFEGMPDSAVRMGMVDVVAPVAELAERLVEYQQARSEMDLPEDDDALEGSQEENLSRIFDLLHARTGSDFSHYKRSTMLRRIGRRMQVHRIKELRGYLAFLRSDDDEAQALLQDLLISVTNFFRDEDAFEALWENVIPQLFDDCDAEDTVRVWAAGCATGEEAYTLAILLREYAAQLSRPPEVQVFATDMGAEAIQAAREGLYPENIEADLSKERVDKFFEKKKGGYRVRRVIRESVIFAEHDLMSDPPFSRLDLIACRNLLIYLKHEVQERVFEVFHYALRPGGYLFLGSAESATESNDLFHAVDKGHRIYRRRDDVSAAPNVTKMPFVQRGRSPAEASRAAPSDERRTTFDDVRDQLLEDYTPPSVIVNAQHDIVHVFAGADPYLRFAPGAPTHNVLEAIRPALRTALRSALFQSKNENGETRSRAVSLEENGQRRRVRLAVRPMQDSGFLQVRFEPDGADGNGEGPSASTLPDATNATAAAAAAAADLSAEDRDALVDQLEDELSETRRELRNSVEEYETSMEELRASNEELQSMNEEMRSTTEELETSKEELQSMNEELTTVNQELQSKNEELSRVNSDLQNLLSSTEIATLFLDRDMRVQRFTPRATDLFNIIESDRGRPLEHITKKFDYEGLKRDARRVLNRLMPVVREIQNDEGRWFMEQVRPYRTVEDKIDGVVLTFVDITERKDARDQLQAAKQYAEKIVNTVREPLLVLNDDLRVQSANRSFYETFQVRPTETQGTLIYELGNGQWDIPQLRRLLDDVLPHNETFTDFLVEHEFDQIGPRRMILNARRVRHEQLILLAIEDVTEQGEAEEALRQEQERHHLIMENTRDYALFTLDAGGRVNSWNSGAEEIFGYGEHEILGEFFGTLFTEEQRAEGMPEAELQRARETGEADDDNWLRRSDGSHFWADGVTSRLDTPDGELRGYFKILRDNTERKEAEDALRRSEQRFRTLNEALPDIAWEAGPDGKLTYANRRLTEYTGRAFEGEGESWQGVLHPEEQGAAKEGWEEALKQGATYEIEHRLRRHDGAYRWFLTRALPARSEDGEITHWLGTTTDIHDRKEAQQRLGDLNERLEERVRERIEQVRDLSASLTMAEQRERHRIAQVLHDSLQQLLYGLEMNMRQFRRSLPEAGASISEEEAEHNTDVLNQMEETLNDAVQEARTLSVELSPPVLRGEGLAASLEWLAEHMKERHGLTVEMSMDGDCAVPSKDLRVLLFQLTNELLFNVVKHAGVEKARLGCRSEDDRVVLCVEDDGAGFDPGNEQAGKQNGFGLTSVRDRLELVGGALDIDSADGKGARVTITAPRRIGGETVV